LLPSKRSAQPNGAEFGWLNKINFPIARFLKQVPHATARNKQKAADLAQFSASWKKCACTEIGLTG
jgi:hypothetical protein